MVPKHIMKSLIPKGDIVNTVSKGHFPTAETFSLTKLKKKKIRKLRQMHISVTIPENTCRHKFFGNFSH